MSKIFYKYPASVEKHNFMGLVPHETDRIISWRDTDPKELMVKLRDAYDIIVACGLEDQLELLVSQAMAYVENEKADADAGEDI